MVSQQSSWMVGDGNVGLRGRAEETEGTEEAVAESLTPNIEEVDEKVKEQN
jgi:hypothetical protein